jgi:hypothetical protein
MAPFSTKRSLTSMTYLAGIAVMAPGIKNYATLLNIEKGLKTIPRLIRHSILPQFNVVKRWRKKLNESGPWTDGGDATGCVGRILALYGYSGFRCNMLAKTDDNLSST